MQNNVTNVLKMQSRFWGFLFLLIGIGAFPVTNTLGQQVAGQNVSYISVKSDVLSGQSQPLEKVLNERDNTADITKQELQITGQVTTQDGETLPGVNVVVQGTTEGTVTDANGQYSLQAPEDGTLIFSFVGYQENTVAINGRSEINVTLQQSVQQLEEIVKVGYSTKRRSELSSSVTVVDGNDIEDLATGNLTTKLQGQVPGLQISSSSGHPGQDAAMLIRGEGSMGADTDPLYVVDGIIGGNVNPNNIESVTVLKDAAATGLYGSRAANGVIIITTKSGQAGETKVSLNSKFGPAFHRTNGLELMNAQQLYENRRQAGQNYYEKNSGDIDESFEDWFNTQVPPSSLDRTANWQDLLSRRGYTNQHNLSVSGGSEKTTFFASADYYFEKGTLVGEDFERIDLRSNLSHQISDRLNLDFRINLGTSNSPYDPHGGQSSWAAQYYINMPWDPAFEEDGDPYNPYESGYWFGNGNANYFYQKEHSFAEEKRVHVTPDFSIEAILTDWLTFSTHNRVNIEGIDDTERFDKYSYQARSDEGRVTQEYRYNTDLTTSNRFGIDTQFGDHNISGTLGQEYTYYQGNFIESIGATIPVGLTALNATANPKAVSGNLTQNGFLSFFGEANYNYANRYYLTASLRSDASSRFGRENRWGTFSSLAGSWLITQEDFFNVPWIDYLKLKASYGVTGNAGIPNYLSLGTYTFASGATYNQLSGALPARLPNPVLTWEEANTTNVGFEFSKGGISLDMDFYHRINENLLQPVPLSSLTGFTGQTRNIGSVRNNGLDIMLNTTNIDQGPWKWTTSFNANFNRNKVLSLHNGEDIDDGNMRISEGKPMRYFYMKKWAGVNPADGTPRWVRWEDADGNIIHGSDHQSPANVEETGDINRASNLFIEPSYPDFTGGFFSKFSYNNLSLNISAYYNMGQKVYYGTREQIDDDGRVLSKNQMVLRDDESRWREEGDVATHPQLLLGGNNNSPVGSSRWLEDGSFLRIQNVTLSYRFPNVFSGFTVKAIANNLTTITNYSGMNPDVDIQDSERGQADPNQFVAPRRLMLGIQMDF